MFELAKSSFDLSNYKVILTLGIILTAVLFLFLKLSYFGFSKPVVLNLFCTMHHFTPFEERSKDLLQMVKLPNLSDLGQIKHEGEVYLATRCRTYKYQDAVDSYDDDTSC